MIKAKVIDVVSDGIISRVVANYYNDSFIVTLIGDKSYLIDREIELIFKETEIILSNQEIVSSSGNCFRGRVQSIQKEQILSRVNFEFYDKILSAIMFNNYNLNENIYWLIKPTEIYITE